MLVVLSFVSQAFVVVDTDNSSNFVEDSSSLEQVPEYGALREVQLLETMTVCLVKAKHLRNIRY